MSSVVLCACCLLLGKINNDLKGLSLFIVLAIVHLYTVSWRGPARLGILLVLAEFPSEKMSLSYLEQLGWRKRHKLHYSLQAWGVWSGGREREVAI